MNKKLLLGVVILTTLALTGSALALAPMGPPTAGLKTGQFRAGVDYSYSNMDFKIDWGSGEFTAENIKLNMITANIGYGIIDDLEGFVRLGAGNAEGEAGDIGDTGDYKFAWGLGTKYTFLKQEKLDWGVLFQIGWIATEGSTSESVEGTTTTHDYKLDAYDIEIAVGPTWEAAEGLSIYGGPFFNIFRGDADDDWTEDDGEEITSGTDSADVTEESLFGGYVGAQWDFMENASVFGEFQYVGTGWTFGTGIGWKF